MEIIDPKFNELPVVPIEGEKAATGPVPTRGLSINDTIAAEANKSVGATGINTSGVTSGLDEQDPSARLDIEPVMPAEGDNIYVDPESEASGLPNSPVFSGPTSGFEPLGSGSSFGKTGFDRAGFDSSRFDIEPVSHPFSTEEVSARAYELWCERGCPAGSPEVDWQQAEQDLILRSRGSKAAVAGV